MSASPEDRFELRFRGLSGGARDFAFPCDAQGRVVIDDLSQRERIDYLYARAVVGAEVSPPIVSALLHLIKDTRDDLQAADRGAGACRPGR